MRSPRRPPLWSAFRWPGAGARLVRLARLPLVQRAAPGLTLTGLATLLSALAMWLGAPAPAPEVQPRLTAGSLTPPLPELRPAPQPSPSVPLPAAPPPELFWLGRDPARARWVPRLWEVPQRAPELAVLGRWQLEG